MALPELKDLNKPFSLLHSTVKKGEESALRYERNPLTDIKGKTIFIPKAIAFPKSILEHRMGIEPQPPGWMLAVLTTRPMDQLWKMNVSLYLISKVIIEKVLLSIALNKPKREGECLDI